MVPNDDTPRYGWGPGFQRGYDLGLARYADALRRRMLADDFRDAGWTIGDIEEFLRSVAADADSVGPSR